MNRLSPRPLLNAWFCSGHSPPLSHIGQSSGWLISSSSITPCWALSAASDVSWVRTTMSSVAAVVHDAIGLRCPSTSTRHCRHAPSGSSSGWSQKRGMYFPIFSAARMMSVPAGTETSSPSIVRLTGACSTVKGAPTLRDVLAVLVGEELRRRGHWRDREVTERAERSPDDVSCDVVHDRDVLFAALSVLEPLERVHHPVRAFPARRAFAARLVRVKARVAEGCSHHADVFREHDDGA